MLGVGDPRRGCGGRSVNEKTAGWMDGWIKGGRGAAAEMGRKWGMRKNWRRD